MGKKAKQKGRKKDRRDAKAPVESLAPARQRGARGRLAPELWVAQPRPGEVEGTEGQRASRAAPDAAPSVGQAGRRRPAADGAHAAELAARLASVSVVLQRLLARADAGEGLTRARLSALALLVLGGPRRLGELAAAERVRPPTMTRLVRAMEADGLVAREPDPADRRSIIIRATRAGETQLEVGRTRQLAPLAASIAGLGTRERRTLEDGTELLEHLVREASRAASTATE
jgi:DNA-binding MarR family transcriptional regulator